MSSHSGRHELRRFIGVAVDPQTYRNLAYLLLAFPLGVAYFVVLTAGIATGLGTTPILVGIPLLLSVLAGSVILAELESRMAGELIGADVDREPAVPRDEPLGEYVKRLVTSPSSYLDVFYLISKFAIGLASFVAIVTAGSVSVSFILAPLLYDATDVMYQFGPNVVVDTLPEALGLSAIGLLLALLSLHAFNLATRGLARYTELMLGTRER